MKILVAHDGMGHSDAAMDSLAIAGLPTKGEAAVLHVFPETGDSHGRNKHSESALEVARKANNRLKNILPSWKIKPMAMEGSPARVILEHAEDWKPDLVVVGSGRRHPLAGILLGSVALQVLLHTRTNLRIGRKPGPIRNRRLKILVGFDGSKGSERAIKTVAERKWPKNTSVRVVTVIDPRLPVSLSIRAESLMRSPQEGGGGGISEVQAECLAILKEGGLKADAKYIIGDPKRQLLNEMKNLRVDTVVMGHQGLSAWADFLVGSVSMHVAMLGACSVELIRG